MKRIAILLVVTLAFVMSLPVTGVDAKPADDREVKPERADNILGDLEEGVNALNGPETDKVTRGQLVIALRDAFGNQGPGVNIKSLGDLLHLGEITSIEDMPMAGDHDSPGIDVVLDDLGEGFWARIGFYTWTTSSYTTDDGVIHSHGERVCYFVTIQFGEDKYT